MRAHSGFVVALITLQLMNGNFAEQPDSESDEEEPRPKPDPAVFACEVCRVFCVEYAKRIGDKKTDDHFDIAVDYAI